MQLQLYSTATAPTLAAYKAAAVSEIQALEPSFITRELSFIGSPLEVFALKITEAQAYKAASYPSPVDALVYPYIALEAEVSGNSGTVVADGILAKKAQYDATIRIAEWARLEAEKDINTTLGLAAAAQERFNWRNSMSLSAVMGATLNKSFVTPAPNPNYATVYAVGNNTDQVIITLPIKSLADDMRVIVEAYGAVGDPWVGSYSQLYANPGTSKTLTFATGNKYLVKVRNLPRVPFEFIVDCGPTADKTPAAFTFTDVTGATLNTEYISNSITVTAIDASVQVSISGDATGMWRRNGGAWTSGAGWAVLNDTIQVKLTSANAAATGRSVTLTVGGVSDTYSVTTA